jgi:hypothetical protein
MGDPKITLTVRDKVTPLSTSSIWEGSGDLQAASALAGSKEIVKLYRRTGGRQSCSKGPGEEEI